MADTIRSVRGMNDILPDVTPYWQSVETTVNEVLSSYGYQEIRFPIAVSYTHLTLPTKRIV